MNQFMIICSSHHENDFDKLFALYSLKKLDNIAINITFSIENEKIEIDNSIFSCNYYLTQNDKNVYLNLNFAFFEFVISD